MVLSRETKGWDGPLRRLRCRLRRLAFRSDHHLVKKETRTYRTGLKRAGSHPLNALPRNPMERVLFEPTVGSGRRERLPEAGSQNFFPTARLSRGAHDFLPAKDS